MALLVAAAAARASGLWTAGSWSVTAWAADGAAFFFVGDRRGDNRLGRRFGGALGLFLCTLTSFLRGGLLGLAVLVGAAALIDALRATRALFPAAGFLERGETRFLRLAQQLGLQLLAAGDVVLRRGLARGWSRRGRLRCGLGRFGDGRGRRLSGRSFARAAEDPALLDLDDDRIGAAVAEALFDLAGLDRALEAQRRPGSKLRFFGLVCHSIPSPNLQPNRPGRRVRRLRLDHDRGQ